MNSKANYRRDSFIRWMELMKLNSSQVAKAAGLPYTTVKSFEDGGTRTLSGANESAIAMAFDMTTEEVFMIAHPANQQAEPEYTSTNYLFKWREKTKLSREELAAKVSTTADVIRVLEYKADLSAKWLRRLAPALGTTPGFLLDHDPDAIPADLMTAWAKVDPKQRETAIEALALFKDKKIAS